MPELTTCGSALSRRTNRRSRNITAASLRPCSKPTGTCATRPADSAAAAFRFMWICWGRPIRFKRRSYKDDYFVVVTPSPEPQIDEIRHAYLHYLLDPLALRYFEQLGAPEGLGRFGRCRRPLSTMPIRMTSCCSPLSASSKLSKAGWRTALRIKGAGRSGAARRLCADSRVWPMAWRFTKSSRKSLQLYFPDLVKQIDLAREDQASGEGSVRPARPP